MPRLTMRIRSISLLALACIVWSLPAFAAKNPQINVIAGQSVTHKLDAKVKTVSISDSDVADVVVAGPQEVLINGKHIGLTTLVIWDENNVSHSFNVTVRGPFSDEKIELRVKLAEVNRTKALEMGFDVTGQSGNHLGALYPGKVSAPSIPLAIFNGAAVENATGAYQWVKGGDAVQVMFKALETKGVLKVLAEPNVIAASGQEANFLSGGEIPVPVSVTGEGGSSITIEWKEYGVKVRFVPTIVDTGVINLTVAPSVSSLDYQNSIEISGFKMPALRSRKAETTVELSDGETLVIGGLLMEEETNIRTGVPLLCRIPVLGYLFSSTQKVRTDNELMIVVSPHLVRSLPPGATVQLPGQGPEDQN